MLVQIEFEARADACAKDREGLGSLRLMGLKTLSTLHYSQCGRVENFFRSKILGIKKYFLAANRRANERR
jgi:hypothetical protein